jgi:hypothetical protein
MGHSVGYPDFYHYYYGTSLSPTGRWDIMCSTTNPPTHSSAYLKYYYTGWIDSLPEITASGTYWLNPLTMSGRNCYKIASPNSATEHYVVEYRRRTGVFDNSLYGSGLLVYRINGSFSGQGNAYYDGSSTFDEVYLYRPNGSVSVNGDLATAYLSEGSARTFINDGSNPSGFLHDGSLGGLDIYDIGDAGDSICFTVGYPSGVSADPGAAIGGALKFVSCGPNPARNTATIIYEAPRRSEFAIGVYAVSGQRISNYKLGVKEPGRHKTKIDLRQGGRGTTLPAGVYIVRLCSGALQATGRLVVVK